MPIKIITKSFQEPISVIEMKNYLRIDTDADDRLIQSLITFARDYLEGMTRRSYLLATYELHLDGFHEGQRKDIWPFGCSVGGPTMIVLPLLPVVSVSSITYTDASGSSQTLSPSAYTVDVAGGRIQIQAPPLTATTLGSVVVTFTAGGAMRDSIKQALRLIVADGYENRAAETPNKAFADCIQRLINLDRLVELA